MQGITPETMVKNLAAFGASRQVRQNRVEVKILSGRLHNAVAVCQAMLFCDRLITISTVDRGEVFSLLYHLIGPHRIIVTLATDIPRGNPATPTLSDLLPPAAIYERQIHDLFGIVFVGHPGLQKIILNEDWPDGEYPLRKDWKPNPGTFYGGIRPEER